MPYETPLTIDSIKESKRLEKNAKMKLYYLKNKDSINAKCKVYYKAHLDIFKEKGKKWQNNNREKVRESNKAWYRKNTEKRAEYLKRYYKENIGARLVKYARTRLYTVLKNNDKAEKTLRIIGCTTTQLKTYIESMFTPGMTWENYGKWHIDHIIPCASFDFTNKENQFKCFHYTNLQPLWAKENLIKGKKIHVI